VKREPAKDKDVSAIKSTTDEILSLLKKDKSNESRLAMTTRKLHLCRHCLRYRTHEHLQRRDSFRCVFVYVSLVCMDTFSPRLHQVRRRSYTR
jgi:hypothetical protein